MDPFSLLHPQVQRWVWLQGWQKLRPIQLNSFAPILSADTDVIIGAPTAGGKTEAAYLPILSNLLQSAVAKGFAVLNISPLKALINDQATRLTLMTADMGIDVTPWHGDVAASVKTSAMKHPSGILIITPESLESMMVNRPHSLETAFSALRYVVVDELHAFMGSERGKQVQSLLSRIEHIVGRRIPRIALSATLHDYVAAAEFLRPHRDSYPVCIPDAGGQGHDTLVLIKECVADEVTQFDSMVAEDIYRNLRGSNNLVFANSRKEAEGMALKLSDLCRERSVPDEFMVHHGSLSKTARTQVEKALKSGEAPATAICTSTLELGVDIGTVQSIAQLVSANSVSALRQRLGRSGRREAPSVLRIYSLDEQRDDYKYLLRTNLVQNIAVVQLLSRGLYEPIDINALHYSTLIQQVLSVTAQYGSFYPAEAYRLLCTEGAFTGVTVDDFLDILRALGAKDMLSQSPSGQIVIGRAGERVVHGMDFYTAFVTIKDLNVVDISSGKVVGSVQYMPYVGEYILLAARRWLVERVDEHTGVISVNAAHTTGKHMFEGFGQEIDGIITQQMRRIYESDDSYPYLDTASAADVQLAQARSNYRDLGLNETNQLEINDKRLLFTWGGMKLNRTLALMHKAAGYELPQYDPFTVSDIPADYLDLLRSGVVDLTDLASYVSRKRKMSEKFDYLLPDHLLDKVYASRSLTAYVP